MVGVQEPVRTLSFNFLENLDVVLLVVILHPAMHGGRVGASKSLSLADPLWYVAWAPLDMLDCDDPGRIPGHHYAADVSPVVDEEEVHFAFWMCFEVPLPIDVEIVECLAAFAFRVVDFAFLVLVADCELDPGGGGTPSLFAFIRAPRSFLFIPPPASLFT